MLFAGTDVQMISLTKSIGHLESVSPVVETFFRQYAFLSLFSLVLSKVALSLQDMANLRLLPSLKKLDISNAKLTTLHLLHLVSHASTLQELNISTNLGVDEDARLPLCALPKLQSLWLRETSLSMPCLRLLIYALPRGCRLITIPQACMVYLNGHARRYCARIPHGFVSDPREVPQMTVGVLRRNLQLHKEANADISVTGSKAEMVGRLTALLCDRIADEKIAQRVGRV